MERGDHLEIAYTLSDDPSQLPEEEARLLESALQATEGAYAPFSGFRVGCALLLEGGEVILGNNQENIAYPSGLCAERTALFYAGAGGKASRIRKIAIRALSDNKLIDEPPTPCGACRQVMVEYERQAPHPFVVLMQGEKGKILRVENVRQTLMPFSFDVDFCNMADETKHWHYMNKYPDISFLHFVYRSPCLGQNNTEAPIDTVLTMEVEEPNKFSFIFQRGVVLQSTTTPTLPSGIRQGPGMWDLDLRSHLPKTALGFAFSPASAG